MDKKEVSLLDGPGQGKKLKLHKEADKFKYIMVGADEDFIYNVEGNFAKLEKEDVC